MIAITLVAGLSTGMLMAMRTSLLTYEKTAKRLESNRRFVKTQQMLSDQISAVMPVQGACLGEPARPSGFLLFSAAPKIRCAWCRAIRLPKARAGIRKS